MRGSSKGGTGARPRLCVFRSLNHIYAQVIDDVQGHTLAAASTLDAEVRDNADGKTKTGKAELAEDIDKIIQFAYEQSTRWGHMYIGTEHLLAGIFLAGAGAGFQILTDNGIALEKVKEETAKLIVCRSEPAEQ